MSGREEILAGIAAVAEEHLGYRGALDPDMRLVEDLELDSVRLLTLAIEVENRFRVRLTEEDEEAIVTLGDLAAAVERQQARQASVDEEGGRAPSVESA